MQFHRLSLKLETHVFTLQVFANAHTVSTTLDRQIQARCPWRTGTLTLRLEWIPAVISLHPNESSEEGKEAKEWQWRWTLSTGRPRQWVVQFRTIGRTWISAAMEARTEKARIQFGLIPSPETIRSLIIFAAIQSKPSTLNLTIHLTTPQSPSTTILIRLKAKLTGAVRRIRMDHPRRRPTAIKIANMDVKRLK